MHKREPGITSRRTGEQLTDEEVQELRNRSDRRRRALGDAQRPPNRIRAQDWNVGSAIYIPEMEEFQEP
jgi:hypothetical protein